MTPETPLTMTWEGDRAPFAKAFVAAQKATEAVKKAATNPHFRSKYADLAEVVEATVPALNANGIAVMQSPGFDGELVTVTTTLLHESGAYVSGTLSMRPTKNDPQGVGSAITYARRYALLAMTGAAPEDDDANAASKQPERPTMLQQVREASKRKSAAQAKADGDHDTIKGEIAQCADEATLDGWIAARRPHWFAIVPTSWEDAINDMIESRRNDIIEQQKEAA